MDKTLHPHNPVGAANPAAPNLEATTLEAHMDACAALLGLPLLPEHRPGVLRYLQLVAALAPRVTDFAATLGGADESGNTFKPVPAPPGDWPTQPVAHITHGQHERG